MSKDKNSTVLSNIENFEKDISYYRAEALKKGEEVKAETDEIILSLLQKKENFINKKEKVKKESKNAIDDFQIGIDMAIGDLNIAFESAKERLQKIL